MTRNSSAATLQVQVKFDQDFFCSADVASHALRAQGIIHSGPNQFPPPELNFFNQNDTSASAAQVPYLAKPGKPHTLTTLQSPHGSETVKAILIVQETPGYSASRRRTTVTRRRAFPRPPPALPTAFCPNKTPGRVIRFGFFSFPLNRR